MKRSTIKANRGSLDLLGGKNTTLANVAQKPRQIAVDLDGTLAYYDGWKGIAHIGGPIEPMVFRVRQWLSEGHKVWIFTSRVAGRTRSERAMACKVIRCWCQRYIGTQLPITSSKSREFAEFWDDRAVRVKKNTGEVALAIGEGPAGLLQQMAITFAKRNAVYKNNWSMIGKVMAQFFPDGVVLKTEDDFLRWSLFDLLVAKLTRLACSGITHKDSIHDCGPYSAMLESIINENTKPINKPGGVS